MPVFCMLVHVPVCVQGFDEFMNLVMDGAEEIYLKNNNRRQIGMLCVL